MRHPAGGRPGRRPGPTAVRAACLDVQAVYGQPILTYDPYATGVVDAAVTLRVRRLDPSISSTRLLLADADSPAGLPTLGRAGPVYDLRWTQDSDRRVLVGGAEQPNATNGVLVEFPARGNDTVEIPLRLRIAPGQDVAAGDYYEPLELRYTCSVGDEARGPAEIDTRASVALDLTVRERVTTYVGAVGARRGQIDLGRIDGDQRRPTGAAVITAQSTAAYDIDITAQNGALVRHAGDRYRLPYELRVSDLVVSDGSRLSCGRSAPPAGRQHSVRVALDGPAAATAAAGAYSETLTFTFTPRLGLANGDGCTVSAS